MKHLSRMITAHNCFCSFLCNLASLVLMPAFLIPINVIAMRSNCSISLVVTMTILAFYTIFLDYYSFNGITSKVFSLGMIKNSPYTARYLKYAVLADQIRRFIQIVIPPIISVLIVASAHIKGIDIKFLVFTLTMIFLNYSSTTCLLTIMRNILTDITYVLISIPIASILGVLNACMMFLFIHSSIHIPFIIWLPISVITSVIISIYVFRYTTGRCLANIQGDLT